jgi:uncharacterized OsmC-like protein/pimeloyl-ACP methyl ester carboxylesterase
VKRSKRINFRGGGGDALAARLDLPLGPPVAYALFAHCFTCSKDTLAASRISESLTGCGIAVLRFDFTGLGGSEGEFANTNFSSNIADLVAAADHLRAEFGGPGILIGHSLGGTAVLAAAARIETVTAVVTINAPFDPKHVLNLFQDEIGHIEEQGEAEVTLGGRRFHVRREFLADVSAQRMEETIGALHKPLLVFHAPQDATVSVENARLIFEAARHPKSFVALDGANHLLTRSDDAQYVAAVISAWVSNYIPRPVLATGSDAPRDVLVEETRTGKYTQTIIAGPHRIAADEPRPISDDIGMSPYELLTAALGACTSMTLRMFAERHGWPLDRVSVRLSHGKEYVADCAECDTKNGKIDVIDRSINLVGQLDGDQRKKLLAVSEMCPVHRTLQSAITIRTRWSETTD